MGDADATAKLLQESDRRFAEFALQHMACGSDDASLQGDEQVTMLRCSCGAVCAAEISIELYVDYLREFKAATGLDLGRGIVPPGSDRPS